MRSIVLISAAAALSAGAWWWYKSRSQTPSAVAENSGQGNAWSSSPIDWLNLDLESTYFPQTNAETAQGSLNPSDKGAAMTRGIANNNPLNIREDQYTDYDWQGEAAEDWDKSFEEFEHPFYGIRAAARIMRNYDRNYGLNTIRGIVSRWAPPSDDNPTENYIAYVAKNSQIDADSPLGAADYIKVVAAMITFENGYNPYDNTLIAQAVAAGLE